MGTLAAGIKEIFATAKTTGSNVMLCGNDGTPDGHMTMANLASVLGGLETQSWNGGSFENLLRHNRQGVYYVDQDYNGIQSDMPFPYCVISINYISYGSNNDVQAQAIAFNITNGDVKYKCVSGIGSDRDYPWRDIPVGLASFYKDYNSLSSLASALGENTIRYYVCDRYNQGLITDVFCSYFDQELPSSEQPVIVKVRSNTIGMAVGIKIDQNYGGFIIIGYDGVIAVIKHGGSWVTKTLAQ